MVFRETTLKYFAQHNDLCFPNKGGWGVNLMITKISFMRLNFSVQLLEIAQHDIKPSVEPVCENRNKIISGNNNNTELGNVGCIVVGVFNSVQV